MRAWQNCGMSLVLAGLMELSTGLPSLAQRQGQPPKQGNPVQGLMEDSQRLFQLGGSEFLQQALTKLVDAIALSKAANDKPRLALALLASGRIFDDLGDVQKALDHYEQALPITRGIGRSIQRRNDSNQYGYGL